MTPIFFDFNLFIIHYTTPDMTPVIVIYIASYSFLFHLLYYYDIIIYKIGEKPCSILADNFDISRIFGAQFI